MNKTESKKKFKVWNYYEKQSIAKAIAHRKPGQSKSEVFKYLSGKFNINASTISGVYYNQIVPARRRAKVEGVADPFGIDKEQVLLTDKPTTSNLNGFNPIKGKKEVTVNSILFEVLNQEQKDLLLKKFLGL